MKIGIAGGGPAGLYFALLMKKQDPSHQIRVLEQNPAGNTYGWGVVFSGRALAFLEESDPEVYADIDDRLIKWDDLAIVHQDDRVAISGNAFSGISRIALLEVFQSHCRRLGVDIRYGQRLANLQPLADCDLIVGADGVNSVVRQGNTGLFKTEVDVRPNKYAWYGTHQNFDALTLTFRQNEHGIYIAHSYRYDATTSAFIVECVTDTWDRAGFAAMTDAESRAYCQRVFEKDLGGHPLLSNRSNWINFAVIRNGRWSHNNVVLLGDALRTVHFSIGSGTRNALEDAAALARSFALHPGQVPPALADFQKTRKPGSDAFQQAAAHSYVWYEKLDESMALGPVPFAYAYMTRTGRVGHEQLRDRDPAFVAAYEAAVAAGT